jgi:hypothetical protein
MDNIELRKLKQKEYYQKTKEKRSEYRKNYQRNIPKEEKNNYLTNWKKNNPLKTLYYSSFYKISGYTFEEFESHLIILGWEKGLHIDHKIPVTHFSPNTPIRLINHLQNLHPVKPSQNWLKGNRYQDYVDKNYYEEIKQYLIV